MKKIIISLACSFIFFQLPAYSRNCVKDNCHELTPDEIEAHVKIGLRKAGYADAQNIQISYPESIIRAALMVYWEAPIIASAALKSSVGFPTEKIRSSTREVHFDTSTQHHNCYVKVEVLRRDTTKGNVAFTDCTSEYVSPRHANRYDGQRNGGKTPDNTIRVNSNVRRNASQK